MPTIVEGKLQFSFPNGWRATKYDDWTHYRNQGIKLCGGAKAVDILLLDPSSCSWLLEVKDYRQFQRTKTVDLGDEIAGKVRDTLAVVAGAQHHASDPAERDFSRRFIQSRRIRVVLHLEQPSTHSKLFPRAINPADVCQRLRQLLKPIDPHPQVVEIGSMSGIAWDVAILPTAGLSS